MNWKKGILAAMLVAGSMFTLTGCGDNEREKALAPYVGTWTATYSLAGTGQQGKIEVKIEKVENNPNVLVAKRKRPLVGGIQEQTITYDEKEKVVKLDNTETLVIQKDEKGEYFSGHGMAIPSHKYYKQAEK